MEAWAEKTINELMLSGDSLCHIGVKERSGRRPWGSGDRPYQRLERERRGITSERAKKKTSKLLSDIKSSIAKSKKKRQAAKARSEEKRRAIEEHRKKVDAELAEKKAAAAKKIRDEQLKDIKYVREHLDELSSEELKAVKERFNLESDARSAVIRKINAGKDYADAILGYANTGINAYNTVARILNAIEKDNKKKLPIIQGGGKQK